MADFEVYFMAVRKWFYGLLLAVTMIDIGESILKGPDYMERLGGLYQTLIVTLVLIALIGVLRPGRRLHGGLALVALVLQLVQLLATYPLLA